MHSGRTFCNVGSDFGTACEEYMVEGVGEKFVAEFRSRAQHDGNFVLRENFREE